MSRDSYSSYELSARQKKRLEEERKRKEEEERRRREEARRKEIERRKREEVKMQKNRLAVIEKFKEKSVMVKQKETQTGKTIKRQQSSQLGVADEMRKNTADLKEQLESLPREWQELLDESISEIKHTVQEVEKSNYDPFYYQRLKWAHKDMDELIKDAVKRIEEIQTQAQQARQSIDELIAHLLVAKDQAVLSSHRQEAGDLVKQLLELLEEHNSSLVISTAPGLLDQANQLLNKYDQVQKREDSRQYVMNAISDILINMGYRPVKAEAASQKVKEAGPEYLYFQTPENGAIEIACGLDESLHTEFVTLKDNKNEYTQGEAETDQNMYYLCEKWCQDYEYLLKSLGEKNIHLQEKWREPPHQGPYKKIYISNDQGEDFQADFYSRHSDQNKRRQS